VQRFGAISVRIYADDHRPPHFHIVGPDFQVLVRVSDLAVIAGEARPAQIAEPMDWRRIVATFSPSSELNERG
jgi:hypothetical protein